ncbi:MAG: MFS transporter, partial [Chloroflexota bacterium]
GYIVGQSSGLDRFMILIGVGVFFGLIAVWTASFIPGGAPVKKSKEQRTSILDLLKTTRDKNFRFYLLGFSLFTLAATPLVSFLPLYMQEQIGLDTGSVVWLQTGTLGGGLISTYLWGWASDRYGSKPVMISGISLKLLVPIGLLLIPRNTPESLYIALGLTLLQGVADMGWVIGSARLLYVGIVPTAKKTEYMALYFATTSIIGGISDLTGGLILDSSAGLSGQLWIFTIDPYFPLLAISFILPIVSLFLFRYVRADSNVTTGQFASMLFRGNLFLATESLIRYYFAKDERAVVSVTERLGQAKSPLAVNELLESLTDPRFNVRFETIISMARTRPDPQITAALIKLLNGTELALAVQAAWALGRIGDPEAVEPLRQGLNSPYRSIQAHAARALGTLKDREVVPELRRRLRTEQDKGLQMAYASALGNLGDTDAIHDLLTLLRDVKNEGARLELALALARLSGEEFYFVQLARQIQGEAGTVISQAVTTFKKSLTKALTDDTRLAEILTTCADAFAQEDLNEGAALLSQLVSYLIETDFDENNRELLQECVTCLDKFRENRVEYIILALHILNS